MGYWTRLGLAFLIIGCTFMVGAFISLEPVLFIPSSAVIGVGLVFFVFFGVWEDED